jgi:hypothetical protein
VKIKITLTVCDTSGSPSHIRWVDYEGLVWVLSSTFVPY